MAATDPDTMHAPGGPHLLHVCPGFDAGGAQMRTLQLMAMLPAGTRHTVLAMNGAYRLREFVPEGVVVDTLGTPPRLSFLAMGRHMAALIRDLAPDAVLTYNWGSIEAILGGRRAGFSPLIHHEDGFGPEEAERCLRRRIWIRRYLLRSAAAVAVPSRVLRDLAIQRFHVPAARVHYLPNGVDVTRFAPVGSVAITGESSATTEVILGHVGHLRPEKDQALLLDAFAHCPSRSRARLRIWGDGPEASRLRQLALELGLGDRVEFLGTVADTAPIYREMDVFVLSSRTEQMPLTVLEAMASGLPVVSTDVGDILSMVHESNRELLCAKGDSAALAARIDRAVGDAAFRRMVGSHNRVHAVAHFDRELRYRAWVDLYASLVGF